MPLNDDDRRQYNRTYYRNHVKPKRGKKMDLDRSEKKVAVSVRMPLALIGRIQRIVMEGLATGKFPWKTTGAAITALIIKGMESMAGDETIDSMLPYLRAVQMIEHVGQHRIEAQAALSKIKTEVSELLAIKANDEAVQYFHSMYDSVDAMDETVWQGWMLRELRGMFPQLLKQKPKGVSFLNRNERRSMKMKVPIERRRAGSRKPVRVRES